MNVLINHPSYTLSTVQQTQFGLVSNIERHLGSSFDFHDWSVFICKLSHFFKCFYVLSWRWPRNINFYSTFWFDAPLRPFGLAKSPQKGPCFQVRKIKVGNSGVLHKTKLKGNPETYFFVLCNFCFWPRPEALLASQKWREMSDQNL